jgi:hypothetical protein
MSDPLRTQSESDERPTLLEDHVAAIDYVLRIAKTDEDRDYLLDKRLGLTAFEQIEQDDV